MSWRHRVPRPARSLALRVVRPWRRRMAKRRIRFGSFRRVTPIDSNWGFTRGGPIDRVYIAAFLERHAGDITGRILEIASPQYTRQFGSGVTSVDVLMVEDGNPDATIIADLTYAPHIADDSFDCVIVTQTLQFIYDYRAALATLCRVLRPGGVLLLTVPGITKISTAEDASWGQWWSFTPRSVQRLLDEGFGDHDVTVASFGNVLSAAGFLYGLADRDLTPAELGYHSPAYPVIIGARAVK